jgi:WD40 repeat protein
MRRELLSLCLVCTFVTAVQAQSCAEALVYHVASATDGQTAPLLARTLCDHTDEVLTLATSFRAQNAGLDAWFAPDRAAAYGFGSVLTFSEVNPTPQVVLEENDTAYYHNPMWSPNGDQLLVVETSQEGEAEWLVLTDLEGNARRIAQLIANPNDESLIVPITWSPDGQWVSYALSHRLDEERWDANIQLLDTTCIGDPAQTCAAHVLEITDGSGERPMLTTEGWLDVPEHWWGATWSPDSQRLAFVCGDHLCFLNADGTDFQRSDFEFHGHSLAWSPSGNYLAYFADNDIYVYGLRQNERINVTQTPEVQEFLPAWITLPEGEFLFEAP